MRRYKMTEKTEGKWFSVSFSFKSDKADKLTAGEYMEIINKISRCLRTPITIDNLRIKEVR